MGNSIGSIGTPVPIVQTPAAATAGESKSVDSSDPVKKQGTTSSSNGEATAAGAQKQGKETSSMNNLKGDLLKQQLNGRLAKKPSNAEKPKTGNAPESAMELYGKAVQESRVHKTIIEALETQLKNAPDSMKPKIQKAIELEKAMLMDADRRREIYKKPAMEERKLLDKMMEMNNSMRNEVLPNIRG